MIQLSGRVQRTITVAEMQRNFGGLVRRLRTRHEHTVVQSGGVPVAVILPIAEYEQLMAYVRRKAAFHSFARYLGREVEQRHISEEEFAAELESTKHEVFEEQYGHPA
ncbi:MAG: type II toxin-antitoxin system prevent-host-death family antitoxin [Anaerolineae bacterium]